MTSHFLYGLQILVNDLAVQYRWIVQRHPIRKRRRNWRTVRLTEPGCLKMGNTLVMHPAVYAKLKDKDKTQ